MLGFVIHYAWISKLLRDAAFTWRPRELSWWLKEWLISGNLAIWTVHVLEKVLFQCFRVPRGINSRFCSKTQWQMFLLVSGRHVGAHTDGHQHGLPIQISINLGKKFLRISCERETAVTRILARVFAYLPSFISQILDLIYWTVLIFILIYFEWLDTENQQYFMARAKEMAMCNYISCTGAWIQVCPFAQCNVRNFAVTSNLLGNP